MEEEDGGRFWAASRGQMLIITWVEVEGYAIENDTRNPSELFGSSKWLF